MQIFVSRNGETLGPYSPDQIQEMQGKGVVFPMDLVWTEGATEWRPLYQVPDLFQRGTKADEPVSVQTISEPGPKGDIVSEKDIALFVGKRAERYMSAWQNGGKGWNTAACLFPVFWLVYRRMFLYALALECSFIVLDSLIWYVFGFRGIRVSDQESPMRVIQNLSHVSAFLFADLIALMILGGIFGTRVYLRRAATMIRGIKAVYEDRNVQKEKISKAGGTSVLGVVGFWGLLCLVAVGFLAISIAIGFMKSAEESEGIAQNAATVTDRAPVNVTPLQAKPQEDEVLVAIRDALRLTDVKEVTDMPADYIGTFEIVAVQPENGEPTVTPPNAHWQVTISSKSLRSRDSFATFDAIFIGKQENVPCVVALTNTKATYFLAKLDPKAGELGATCYFEAVGKEGKPVKFLLR
jgi:hypothetical protein